MDPRPRDYKSRALPTELKQQELLYIIENQKLSQVRKCEIYKKNAFNYKKSLPAEFHIEKPGVHPLRAKLPCNYLLCRLRGSSLERFFNLQFGLRDFLVSIYFSYIYT